MIAIVDYGLGNIQAFSNVFKKLNFPHACVSNSADLKAATKIVLPGVGSFDYAMEKLNASGMRETLDEFVLEKKLPVIGVCVGMQMMARASDEGSGVGLGWIPGEVKRLSNLCNANQDFPLPHMGWNNLYYQKEDPLFHGLEANPRFYFLHSYYFQCDSADSILATANYGADFATVIRRENIYGIQCHPEKSHSAGYSLLKNFASL
jgi:glutamine amidotransferase